MRRRDHHKVGGRDPMFGGVNRMDLTEGFREVLREARAFTRAGHRVPVVAHPARIEDEREVFRDARLGLRRDRHEPALAVGGEEASLREEARLGGRVGAHARPLKGAQGIVVGLADLGEGADVEVACAVVLQG